ncbi:MAG: hypothetical protein K6G56_04965 [Clostridiales bacterium]|nr:hypothetical protein [Clostridiales bacterium]
MKRLPPGLMLAALGMSIAVSLLMLFAAGVTSSVILSALCVFVASLMTWVPIREENGLIVSAIEFGVVTAVSLLICRRSVYTYLYILLFGNYALVRFYLRTHVRDWLMTALLRMLFFNVMTAIGIAFAQYVLGYDVMTLVPRLSVWAAFGIVEGIFILFMLIYNFFSYLFDSALRTKLLPRR